MPQCGVKWAANDAFLVYCKETDLSLWFARMGQGAQRLPHFANRTCWVEFWRYQMSNSPMITNVGGVRSAGEMEGVNDPGAFTTFDDGTAIFTGGNGVTFEQAAGHYINNLAEQDTAMQVFANNQNAARFGAQFMLQQNQQFAGKAASSEVPQGEQFQMDGTKLKDVLKPFANNLDQLRNMVANMSVESGSGMDSATARTIGNARTPARGLPVGNI